MAVVGYAFRHFQGEAKCFRHSDAPVCRVECSTRPSRPGFHQDRSSLSVRCSSLNLDPLRISRSHHFIHSMTPIGNCALSPSGLSLTVEMTNDTLHCHLVHRSTGRESHERSVRSPETAMHHRADRMGGILHWSKSIAGRRHMHLQIPLNLSVCADSEGATSPPRLFQVVSRYGPGSEDRLSNGCRRRSAAPCHKPRWSPRRRAREARRASGRIFLPASVHAPDARPGH